VNSTRIPDLYIGDGHGCNIYKTSYQTRPENMENCSEADGRTGWDDDDAGDIAPVAAEQPSVLRAANYLVVSLCAVALK